MSFQSILYNGNNANAVREHIPDSFTDLHLDQVVDKMTEGKEQYNLKPFFYAYLQDSAAIVYRQQVMRELELRDVMSAINEFAWSMQRMRRMLKEAKDCQYLYQQERFFLDAVIAYGNSLHSLYRQLDALPLVSEGLCAFRKYLAAYIASPAFTILTTESTRILSGLQEVNYELHIQGLTVQVLPAGPKADYAGETEGLYKNFIAPAQRTIPKIFLLPPT